MEDYQGIKFKWTSKATKWGAGKNPSFCFPIPKLLIKEGVILKNKAYKLRVDHGEIKVSNK